MGRAETMLYTPERFREEYGFDPLLMIDLKALMGDSSDNIPGVPGVGEKTALELVRRFGGIREIYASLDSPEIRPAVKKKLEAGEQSANQSYWLATIFREVPLESMDVEALRWKLIRTPELLAMMRRLGFARMIEQMHLREFDVDLEGAGNPGESTEDPDRVSEADGMSAGPELEEIRIETVEQMEVLRDTVYHVPFTAVYCLNGLEELALAVSAEPRKIYVLSRMALGEAYESFCGELFSAAVPKAASDVKDLMNLLHREGYSREGFVFDTALAGYLLRATDSDYSPPVLSERWLGRRLEGAAAIVQLVPKLRDELENHQMTMLFEEIEMPLCRVLSEMEEKGFFVDRQALADYGASLVQGIEQLEAEIWDMAGHQFNILSPKQLGQVLFEELGLPSGKKTKTGWSTNADVLEKLRYSYPIADKVLEYRTLTKLKSTYADGLLKVIDADGRIHTSFQMTVTATGRLSSTEPNLQNIPVRKELGARIRTMFAAPEGSILVDADYSQIELRLLAHISGDETMCDAFLSGEDFHTVTASQVFGVPLSEVSHTLRSRAKAVNFGIVYGISAFSLAQDIGVRVAEAKEYMDAYLERFSGVRDYMHNVVEQAKKDGYVTTLFHRRRDLPELKSANRGVRSFGERVALNMPIQGTAADIIKLAMVRVRDRLAQECPEARLVLQVHDELIVECPEAQAERVRVLLEEEMEQVVSLRVPLLVEAKAARTWAEAH